MAAASPGPTLDSLVRQLAELTDVVAALQLENARLRSSVAELGVFSPGDHVQQHGDRPSTGPSGRLHRRSLLRNAMLAVAGVSAGVLIGKDDHRATASHTPNFIDVNNAYVHSLHADSDDGEIAVDATVMNGSNPAISGVNVAGNGIGVLGTGNIGVKGTTALPYYGAVYGESVANEGYGVVGDASGTTTAGILGRNSAGDGMRGEGRTGLHGVSPNGSGILGEGGSGYGGVFRGTRAQVRLAPTGRTGKPVNGAHQVGELYLDKTGSLFLCTAAGTPGTWRKVNTTVA